MLLRVKLYGKIIIAVNLTGLQRKSMRPTSRWAYVISQHSPRRTEEYY
jgi:hypothetical protein